jgi:hypothetical protein
MISVSFCSPEQLDAVPWQELLARATPNVFAHPVALKAAADTGFADIRVLLAWDDGEGTSRLVGLWALRLRRVAPFWPPLLEALPYKYAFLSNPVIDLSFMADVMPAFLAAIVDSALPKIIHLRDFDAEAPSYAALVKAVAARGRAPLRLAEDARPMASRSAGVKTSGSTRKKLRQDWNRLSGLGGVEIVHERTPDAVRLAFERFLSMEAASWKGANRTALLSDPEDAAFVRRLVGDLADQGEASVALLRAAGRDIAAQVVMYAGATAYTWKTAYVAEFGRYSPGALLVDKLTEALLATPGIDSIDSCSTSDGFMAGLWSGRRSMVELLVPVGTNALVAFQMESARRRGFHRLRQLRNRLRERYGAFRRRRAA